MASSTQAVEQALRGLSMDDRVSVLVHSITADGTAGAAAAMGLIGLMHLLGERLPLVRRFNLAEAMRDVADLLERDD
jgi:hypothetical protein